MEGSKSEAVFESYNLKPQLLINEAFNIVDDVLDLGFDYFLQEGSMLLKTEDTDRSAELSKGVAYIKNLIQSNLNQRLEKWEEHCHRFCFHVPDEISLPGANEVAGDDLPNIDELANTDLDKQLKSLHDKLTEVGEESSRLERELRLLEKRSSSSSKISGSIDEVLQFCKEQNIKQIFQELMTTASELHEKLENPKRRRMEETQCIRIPRAHAADDLLKMHVGKGVFGSKLEELEEFVDEISKS